jgi:putative PIN family toxin of toxin-antitoxin system
LAPPRAVADTNVWVAAAVAPAGVCGCLLTAALQSRWKPVVSPLLVDELRTVLLRPKFRRWLSLDEVGRFVADLAAIGDNVDDPAAGPRRRSRDPDDEFLLALAEAADVEALVSGDSQLLELRTIPPVVTPAAFLRRIEQDAS